MSYHREEAARQQDALETVIRMREPRQRSPHPDPMSDPEAVAVKAAAAAAVVMATLSTHAAHLSLHVIKAAAIAAGNATAKAPE